MKEHGEMEGAGYMTRTEFCRRVGITRETLRHYVDRGLVRPIKHEENRYQLYSLADAAVVFCIREMRSLNLSLDTIAEEMALSGTEGFAQSVVDREKQLLLRQREIERELAYIRYKREVSSTYLSAERRSPRLQYYAPSVSAYYDGTAGAVRRVRTLADRFPYSYGVLKFPIEPRGNEAPFQLGMLLPESALAYGELLDLSGYQPCAPMRVVAGFDIADLSRASARDFMSVVEYAQRHRYRIIGDIVAVVHHVYRTETGVGGIVTAGVGVAEEE